MLPLSTSTPVLSCLYCHSCISCLYCFPGCPKIPILHCSKCGHGHLHRWTRKKTSQQFQKLHSQVTSSYVFVASLNFHSCLYCHSCISCLYFFLLSFLSGMPKNTNLVLFKRGGGVKCDTEQLLRFYFPFRGVAMSSKHLMYIVNYLELLFHL